MHELGLYSDSLGGKNMINNKKILIGLVALFGLGSIVESLAQTANESANTEESNILETWKFTGELSAGARLFFEDPLYYGQADHAFPIVEGRLSASRTWNDGKHRLMIEGYGRWDQDTDTSVVDLPEAYYQYVGENGSILVGSHIEFWGVAESYNPVNVINQKDNAADIRTQQRLGQPMVKVELGNDEVGTLALFGLVGFREREYGDRSSRFRAPWIVDDEFDSYEDKRDIDFAGRYSHAFDVGEGSLDVAVSYFNGTSREAKLLPACLFNGLNITKRICKGVNRRIVKRYENDANIMPGGGLGVVQNFLAANFGDDEARRLSKLKRFGFQPYYQHLEQAGLEVAYGKDNLQVKFEGAWKHASDESYVSTVSGLEYTFSSVKDTDYDVTLIGEYLYDDRSMRQPYTNFDNDIFGAIRIAANNTNNTVFTAGMFYDVDTKGTIGVLEFSTRLNDAVKLEAKANIFQADGWDDPLAAIAHDSYVDIKLTTFF